MLPITVAPPLSVSLIIIVWKFCKDFIGFASDLTMFGFKMAFGFALGNSSTVEMNLSTA